jgi:hypothetical protein
MTALPSLLAKLPIGYRLVERQSEDPGMTHTSIGATRGSAPPAPGLSRGAHGRIDVDATLIAFRRTLGQIAAETNETPRSILEDEFKRAPSDEFWRATMGADR